MPAAPGGGAEAPDGRPEAAAGRRCSRATTPGRTTCTSCIPSPATTSLAGISTTPPIVLKQTCEAAPHLRSQNEVIGFKACISPGRFEAPHGRLPVTSRPRVTHHCCASRHRYGQCILDLLFAILRGQSILAHGTSILAMRGRPNNLSAVSQSTRGHLSLGVCTMLWFWPLNLRFGPPCCTAWGLALAVWPPTRGVRFAAQHCLGSHSCRAHLQLRRRLPLSFCCWPSGLAARPAKG